MAQEEKDMDDDRTDSDHPAASVDRIVVSADDVIESMHANDRDKNERRTHVLRIDPPFEGEKEAKKQVEQTGNYYPPEMSPKPLHISPEAFVIGHSDGKWSANWNRSWNFPDYREERDIFRQESGASRPLSDEEEEEWADWWGGVLEVWESRIRQELNKTEELTLRRRTGRSFEKVAIPVRIED